MQIAMCTRYQTRCAPVSAPSRASVIKCVASFERRERREWHGALVTHAARPRAIHEDPTDPRAKARASLEVVEAGDHGHPRVLHHFFRGARRADERARDALERAMKRAHEL